MFLMGYTSIIQNWRMVMTSYCLNLYALPLHIACTMMVGLCSYPPLLLLGGSNCPPLQSKHFPWTKKVGTCESYWVFLCKGKQQLYPHLMVQGTLDCCLIFSSLLIAYLLSYSKFGSTTSTSKAAIEGTPMVVTIVTNLMKCKLHATLWNPSCNPPQLPPCEFIISSSMFSSWNLKVGLFFSIILYVPFALESNQIIGPPQGRIHLVSPCSFFCFPTCELLFPFSSSSKLLILNLASLHLEWYQ